MKGILLLSIMTSIQPAVSPQNLEVIQFTSKDAKVFCRTVAKMDLVMNKLQRYGQNAKLEKKLEKYFARMSAYQKQYGYDEGDLPHIICDVGDESLKVIQNIKT